MALGATSLVDSIIDMVFDNSDELKASYTLHNTFTRFTSVIDHTLNFNLLFEK